MHFTNARDGGYVGIEILCIFSLFFFLIELAEKPYAFSLANLNSLC